MGTPYGAVVVEKLSVAGSSQVSPAVTFYTPSEDTDFIGFGDIITSGGWSFTISWTDPENNAQSATSSGGSVGLSRMRVKGSTNITYSIFGGTGSYNQYFTLVKV